MPPHRPHAVLPSLLLIIVSCVMPTIAAWADTAASYTKTIEHYDIPDVVLTNQDGAKVKLRTLLNNKKPVMVDFIYTTCTTICPVLSANFTNFQRKMGKDAGEAQLVSISIDPENDTPAAMKKYLGRYRAKPGWEFLTGTKGDIEHVIRAFRALSVFSYNKMDHYPLIIMKSPSRDDWVRIYGLIGTTELMREYEEVKR